MINRNVSVSARIPPERVDQLEQLSIDTKVPTSDILRSALYAYLDEHKVVPSSGE